SPSPRFSRAGANEELLEDLGARAGIVGSVPPELLGVEEATPDADVDLHQPHIARRGSEVGDTLALVDELAPAALLPGRRFHEVVEEVVEAFIERVGIERALSGHRQEPIDGPAVDR